MDMPVPGNLVSLIGEEDAAGLQARQVQGAECTSCPGVHAVAIKRGDSGDAGCTDREEMR